MHKVREVILVEGRYDKNKLSQFLDAVILESSGFGIFNDRQKLELLRSLAEKRGLIILTDSDGAGFVIRNYLKGSIDPRCVKHAYIPDVPGKEKRKTHPSREGKLGVEGMTPQVLLEALRRAGATIDELEAPVKPAIGKHDLYALGLSGRQGSAARRKELMKALELPEHLSSSSLLDVLNALMTREEFYRLPILSSATTGASTPMRSTASEIS